MTEPQPRRWDLPFVLGLVVGGAVMIYGIAGLLDATTTTRARQITTWVVGADLLHDAVLAPIAALVGLAGARLLRPRVWPVVRAGLVASACALFVAYPMLRGFTRDQVPDNASAAPLDYGTAVLTVLVVIWALVAGALLGGAVLRRRRKPFNPRGGPASSSPTSANPPEPRPTPTPAPAAPGSGRGEHDRDRRSSGRAPAARHDG